MKEPSSFTERWSFAKVLILPTPTAPYLLVEEFLSGAKAYGLCFLNKRMSLQDSKSNLGSLEYVVGDSMLTEGAYIIDQRRLPKEIGSNGMIVGPVLNILLPPLTIERISFKKKTFDTLEQAMSNVSTILPLTEVSMDIYAAYWKKLGARIGRKVKDKIKWESYGCGALN